MAIAGDGGNDAFGNFADAMVAHVAKVKVAFGADGDAVRVVDFGFCGGAVVAAEAGLAGSGDGFEFEGGTFESGEENAFDGGMGNHVTRSELIDFEFEIAGADLFEGFLDAGFVGAHRFGVGLAEFLFVVLALAETTVVFFDEDLDMAATRAVGAEDVEFGIAGEFVKGGIGLLGVADGTARA